MNPFITAVASIVAGALLYHAVFVYIRNRNNRRLKEQLPGSLVCVFGVQRKQDREIWFITSRDFDQARNYPDRVTSVTICAIEPKED